MTRVRDPDPNAVRTEVQKAAKKLQEQKELLYQRLFFSTFRLRVIEAQLRERQKNFTDKN
jgi:hypothetical protein